MPFADEMAPEGREYVRNQKDGHVGGVAEGHVFQWEQSSFLK
jgi:hypothetical protein